MHLPEYIDDRQRGFMRDRLGLDNVLLLEATAMLAAWAGSRSPALVFLDIMAAFPSILHDYMLSAVYNFLGDHPLYTMVKNIYTGNTCDMIIRGELFPGFEIFCGVMQGCPL
jgi:hypothetical protein